jgi:hypothetical protein
MHALTHTHTQQERERERERERGRERERKRKRNAYCSKPFVPVLLVVPAPTTGCTTASHTMPSYGACWHTYRYMQQMKESFKESNRNRKKNQNRENTI